MTPMQILNQLYAEKKVTLNFETAKAREDFRQRIYKLKKGQDAAITAILDEEKLVLKTLKKDGEICFFLTLWTEEKKPQSYEVISVEDNGSATNKVNSEVSENLGIAHRSSSWERNQGKNEGGEHAED